MIKYAIIILLIVLCLALLYGCIKTPNKIEPVKEDHIDFTSLLKPMLKSSIRIAYDSKTNEECSVGSSKIGGKPDLPVDFNWYYYKGKSYDDMIEDGH